MRHAASFALLLAVAACAPAKTPPITSLVLEAPDGTRIPLDAALRQHPATVVTFFSSTCPCQRAHDARLRDLIAKETAAGVGFFVVDSEASGTVEHDAAESRERGYPIVRDAQSQLAHALDAEYATYSVVLDASGAILYRGGFDSDRSHLKDARQTYLEDALDDVLHQRPVRRAEAKTLGCTLEVR